MLSATDYVLVAASAVAAGAINALAGGGTLITFPMLTAVGLPAVAANVTSTLALCPGYLGATLAQRKDLRGQRHRLWMFLPASVVGGAIGAVLLLTTGERVFRALVPFLILLASALLAIQEPVRKWVTKSSTQTTARPTSQAWTLAPIGLAAVYGGYFGAGVSVIVLAVLGLIHDDSLTRLNALKQAIAFSANTAAVVFFAFSGLVVWSAVAVMALGALAGGALGGKLAGRVRPQTLRWIVVAIGVGVAIIYLKR